MAAKKIIDIIVPVYNPPSGWVDQLLLSVNEIQSNFTSYGFKLILVNDGSAEETDFDKIKELKQNTDLQFISYDSNKGKGYAVREGVKQSQHDYFIFTDMDFPYSTESFCEIVSSLMKDEADIIIGVKSAEYYNKLSFKRKIISKTLRYFNSKFLGLKVNDTQCGLKGFNLKGKKILLQTTINRYLFDLELIALASKRTAIKMVPIEIKLKDEVRFTKMSCKTIFAEVINFIKILRI